MITYVTAQVEKLIARGYQTGRGTPYDLTEVAGSKTLILIQRSPDDAPKVERDRNELSSSSDFKVDTAVEVPA